MTAQIDAVPAALGVIGFGVFLAVAGWFWVLVVPEDHGDAYSKYVRVAAKRVVRPVGIAIAAGGVLFLLATLL